MEIAVFRRLIEIEESRLSLIEKGKASVSWFFKKSLNIHTKGSSKHQNKNGVGGKFTFVTERGARKELMSATERQL